MLPLRALPTVYRTLRPLPPRQLIHLLAQRLPDFRGRRMPAALDLTVRGKFRLLPGIENQEPRLRAGMLRFINEELELREVLAQRWQPPAQRLWLYNLHYFDWLKDPGVSAPAEDARALQLMAHWCAEHSPGAVNAWDPYPLSLRVVNWIKYLHARKQRLGPAALPDWARRSLAAQLQWLEAHVEYHLRANHLFKNIVALLFGGVFFRGPEAERWLALGSELLMTELGEQFLPDGGHIERTPMYHSLCIEDCLDCWNLLSANPGQSSPALMARLGDVLVRGLAALQAFTAPDGGLAAFSDTAPGIAPSSAQLFDYAARLDMARPNSGEGVICLPESGYCGYRQGREYLLLDCGAMGAGYQPGHAHCDLLSFEWTLAGRKVLADPGVFNYVVSAERHYARSTAAHNTVVVDGCEQGEIWSAFRLGRRPSSFSASVRREDGAYLLSAQHNAYQHLQGGIVHRRVLRRDIGGGVLNVEDELLGSGRHRACGYFHFAPGLKLELEGGVLQVIDEDGVRILRISHGDGLRPRIAEAEHYPGFGLRETAAVLELHWEGVLPARWSCRFEEHRIEQYRPAARGGERA